jgi:hypothetical protein|tara:strand:- start:427 stop:957 length:531 start_codon:yes stop_codon:yes gene_type:complete
MNEQTVPIGALSRVLNLSERRIQQMVKESILIKEERGRYPFLSNIKNYVMYLQMRVEGGGKVLDLDDARKRKLHAEAMLVELELADAQKNTISISDHGEVVGSLGDIIRGRLLVLPSKLAPALALETKQGLCKQIIEDEIRITLAEIARIVPDDGSRTPKGKSGTSKASKEISTAA